MGIYSVPAVARCHGTNTMPIELQPKSDICLFFCIKRFSVSSTSAWIQGHFVLGI